MTETKRTIYAADLFAGAGGATESLRRAALRMNARVELVAVNHSPSAIATHSANFPGFTHYISDVAKVDPKEAVPGGYLDVLLAGVECTHFSRASGKKAKNRQSRSSATEVLWWLESLHVQNVVIENVSEFTTWGPLDENDVPIKHLAGMYFRMFVSALRELGYVVEWQVLNAANYGAKTSRERLCLIATRHDFVIFPRITHRPATEIAKRQSGSELLPWGSAREIIDTSIKGSSIYSRKTPLKPNTVRRVHNGLRKLSGLPFIMANRANNVPKLLTDPIATLCTGNHMYICEPDLKPFTLGQQSCSRPHSLEEPVMTITTGGVIRIANPYLVVLRNNQEGRDLSEPLPTLCTSRGHMWHAEPYLINISHNGSGTGAKDSGHVYGSENPVRTLTTQQEQSICEPYIVRYNGGPNRFQSADCPITTLDTSNRFAIVEPYLIGAGGPAGQGQAKSSSEPLRTILGRNNQAIIEPMIVSYYGNGEAHSIDKPLPTITTRDRFALCEFVIEPTETFKEGDPNNERFGFMELFPTETGETVAVLVGWIDILFRMLQPHELAAAHSFPDWYQFVGTKEQIVAQIGNSWDTCWGEAILYSVLTRDGIVYDKGAKNIGRVSCPFGNDAPTKEQSLYRRVKTLIDSPVDVTSGSLFEVAA